MGSPITMNVNMPDNILFKKCIFLVYENVKYNGSPWWKYPYVHIFNRVAPVFDTSDQLLTEGFYFYRMENKNYFWTWMRSAFNVQTLEEFKVQIMFFSIYGAIFVIYLQSKHCSTFRGLVCVKRLSAPKKKKIVINEWTSFDCTDFTFLFLALKYPS